MNWFNRIRVTLASGGIMHRKTVKVSDSCSWGVGERKLESCLVERFRSLLKVNSILRFLYSITRELLGKITGWIFLARLWRKQNVCWCNKVRKLGKKNVVIKWVFNSRSTKLCCKKLIENWPKECTNSEFQLRQLVYNLGLVALDGGNIGGSAITPSHLFPNLHPHTNDANATKFEN